MSDKSYRIEWDREGTRLTLVYKDIWAAYRALKTTVSMIENRIKNELIPEPNYDS